MATEALPSTHRAAILTQHGDHKFSFATETVPLPHLEPSQILVRLTHSGVCGSDLHLASGHMGPVRSVLGHEGVGRVVALGSAVSADLIAVGARVGIAWVRDICGDCAACLRGEEGRCGQLLTSGRVWEGSFAEYAVVPARYVIRLPDEVEGLEDEVVAPILCAGVTAYKAVKVCGATPGAWVAVSGAGGGVGALAVQFAVAMGYRVLAVDVGKEPYCRNMGAEAYLEAGEASVEAVGKATGEGVHAVVVAAGLNKAYQAAINWLAPFGTLVCVGVPPEDQLVNFHPAWFIGKGIRIIGSAVGTRQDILEALEFLRRKVVKPVVEIVELDQLNAITDGLDKATKKYVIKF
ncbi:uncharacterized protein HMPREF1541_09810 [Cyphellophora europaea CBS 101466]|uniref:alcohol dehydrogenase n=1 Tax=Cyphellophora europaea (strain CBS 101466) TaxID=1220924 RepID=W2S8I7_CYPE1|nr:uncharacterized protein HMPREF1541_09810 [Cyphellophora europaea CBS 101466]ETN44935.1 hypothetical protein HMPREF1541_09810 [Cyphellophora europaea CBS 101466]